jgi:hypothetical protein
MALKGRVGITKEEIRRIVLSKLKIVYRDWRFKNSPFWHRGPKAGHRRSDERSFETALLAALLGGLSEAIEKNNQALFTALGRKDQRMRRRVQTKQRKR